MKHAVQSIIQDWDFSSVDSEKAKVVWAFEVYRQYAVDGGEEVVRGQKRLFRQVVRTPWTKVPWSELEQWYSYRFGGTGYKFMILQPDGSLTTDNDLAALFCDAGGNRTAPPGAKRHGFFLNPYVPAQVARKAVIKWFDSYVASKQKKPLPRRGPGYNHLSWLADLAVYRAAKAGTKYGKMATKLTGCLPPGEQFRSKSFLSRQHITDAKRRTRERILDIRKNTFYGSIYGCRDEGPKKVVEITEKLIGQKPDPEKVYQIIQP